MADPKLPKAPRRITLAFGFSYISQRAIREGLGRRQFGKAEMDRVIEWFDGQDTNYQQTPTCVFCGSSDISRWDHLIPIRRDGETVLGNMVLSCQQCDHSKRMAPFEEWMRSTADKAPGNLGVIGLEHKIQRLYDYMEAQSYSPVALDDRLNETERAELEHIRDKLRSLQEDIEAFIGRYQRRANS